MAYDPSAFQLTHLLQSVWRRLKVSRISTATGGSTTTIVDTKLVEILNDSNEDDYLNNWTAIIIKDAGGAGAAPEGQFSRVSDYDDGGTITTADTLTGTVASGDTYMYTSPDFPLLEMIEMVNDSLRSLGNIPLVDTSITTAAGQTEYTLPVAVKGDNLLNVEIQGITTDSDDNRWVEVPVWNIVHAAPGSTGLIIIPQYASGYTIRLTYLGLHPRVSAYSDYISEFIHPEVAIAACVAHALEWYNSQSGGNDRYWLQREDRAFNQLDIARSQFPIATPAGRVQGGPYFESFSGYYPGDRNPR